MRHDSDSWRILVYQHVVRPLVRALGEEVGRIRSSGARQGKNSRDDGLLQPWWQRSIDQLVLNEIRRPCLETSMSQLFPAGFRGISYLLVKAAVVSCYEVGAKVHVRASVPFAR